MSMQVRNEELYITNKAEREGLVVWDHTGLVVLWPDGHRHRFSWTALRQACLCAECGQQRGEPGESAEQRSDGAGSSKDAAARPLQDSTLLM